MQNLAAFKIMYVTKVINVVALKRGKRRKKLKVINCVLSLFTRIDRFAFISVFVLCCVSVQLCQLDREHAS